jgi:uncharacterized protein with GYD domain
MAFLQRYSAEYTCFLYAISQSICVNFEILWLMAFLTVLEAPDPETVARVSVELGLRGTATFETLAAIPVDDFIASLKKS